MSVINYQKRIEDELLALEAANLYALSQQLVTNEELDRISSESEARKGKSILSSSSRTANQNESTSNKLIKALHNTENCLESLGSTIEKNVHHISNIDGQLLKVPPETSNYYDGIDLSESLHASPENIHQMTLNQHHSIIDALSEILELAQRVSKLQELVKRIVGAPTVSSNSGTGTVQNISSPQIASGSQMALFKECLVEYIDLVACLDAQIDKMFGPALDTHLVQSNLPNIQKFNRRNVDYLSRKQSHELSLSPVQNLLVGLSIDCSRSLFHSLLPAYIHQVLLLNIVSSNYQFSFDKAFFHLFTGKEIIGIDILKPKVHSAIESVFGSVYLNVIALFQKSIATNRRYESMDQYLEPKQLLGQLHGAYCHTVSLYYTEQWRKIFDAVYFKYIEIMKALGITLPVEKSSHLLSSVTGHHRRTASGGGLGWGKSKTASQFNPSSHLFTIHNSEGDLQFNSETSSITDISGGPGSSNQQNTKVVSRHRKTLSNASADSSSSVSSITDTVSPVHKGESGISGRLSPIKHVKAKLKLVAGYRHSDNGSKQDKWQIPTKSQISSSYISQIIGIFTDKSENDGAPNHQLSEVFFKLLEWLNSMHTWEMVIIECLFFDNLSDEFELPLPFDECFGMNAQEIHSELASDIFRKLETDLPVFIDGICLTIDPICLVSIMDAIELFYVRFEEIVTLVEKKSFIFTRFEYHLSRISEFVDKKFSRFIDKQVEAIKQIDCKIGSKKRGEIMTFVKTCPLFLSRVESMLSARRRAKDSKSSTLEKVDDAYNKVLGAIFSKLEELEFDIKKTGNASALTAAVTDTSNQDVGGTEEKEVLNMHVLLLENLHFLYAALTSGNLRSINVFEKHIQHIKTKYEVELHTYILLVLRRPFGKLMDFFDGVEELLKAGKTAQEVGYHLDYNKQALKKVLSLYPSKEIWKQLSLLYKRVDKHFPVTPTGSLIDVVWDGIKNEVLEMHQKYEHYIRDCYNDSKLGLSVSLKDLKWGFSDEVKWKT